MTDERRATQNPMDVAGALAILFGRRAEMVGAVNDAGSCFDANAASNHRPAAKRISYAFKVKPSWTSTSPSSAC